MTPSQLPEGAVVITTAQMYAEQVATTKAVTELSGKLDALGLQFAKEQENKHQIHADHEARLRILERSRWPLPSLALVVSILAIVLPLILKGR